VAYCEARCWGAHEDPSIRALGEEGITWTNENNAACKYGPTMNILQEDKRDDVPEGGDVGVTYCEVKCWGAHEDPSIEVGITWTNENNTACKYGPTTNTAYATGA